MSIKAAGTDMRQVEDRYEKFDSQENFWLDLTSRFFSKTTCFDKERWILSLSLNELR